MVLDPLTVVRSSRSVVPDRGYLSTPRPVEFPTTGGATAHALFFAPVNSDCAPPPGELPPLLGQDREELVHPLQAGRALGLAAQVAADEQVVLDRLLGLAADAD